MLLKLLIFTKERRFAAPLEENKKEIVKKSCGFVDSEFVKICHRQVTNVGCYPHFTMR